MINHCRNNYNWNDDDTRDYQVKWVKIGTKDETSSSLDNNSTEIQTTTPITTTTTARPTVPPSQRKKSKYRCQNAWCYQVNKKTL